MKRKTIVAATRKAWSLTHGFNPVRYGIALAGALILGVSAQAAVGNIGLNFQGRTDRTDPDGPTEALAPTDIAGVKPQGNWNNYANGNDGNSSAVNMPLKDETGAATPVTISFASTDSWNNDSPAATTPDGKLMFGVIKANTATPAGPPAGGVARQITFTFKNVPVSAVGWDLYAYTTSNGDNIQVNNTVGSTTYYTVEQHQFNGTYTRAVNTDPSGTRDTGNYVRFENIQPNGAGEIVLTHVWVANSDGSGLAGLQLVNLADVIAPSVASTSVSPGGDAIYLTFGEPLDPSAATPGNFTLSGGGTVSGAAFVGTSTSLIKVNVSGLTPNTDYTVNITGVKDVAQNTFAGSTTIHTYSRVAGDLTGLNATDYQVNGGAAISGDGVLTLTTGINDQTRSAFTKAAVNVAAGWEASFIYTATGGADGIGFVIQNDARGAAALGGGGGAMGYRGIQPAAALLLNIYTGNAAVAKGLSFVENNGDPIFGDVGGSVNLSSGHPILVKANYLPNLPGGKEIRFSFTDLVTGQVSETHGFGIDFNTLLGSDYALIGFTGATGGANSRQSVSNFRFTNNTLGNAPIAIISQPANIRVAEGTTAHFEVGVNGLATFQWFKGANPIAGATQGFLDIPTTIADNNTLYHVVVTGAEGTTGNSVTSADARLQVGSLTFFPGYLKYERYRTTDKAGVHNGTIQQNLAPEFETLRTSFNNPDVGEAANNFVAKNYGYIVPAVTGQYTFYMALDDDGELYLSTDESPANAVQIAGQSQWSSGTAWNSFGDAVNNTPDNINNKRSDRYPWPAPVVGVPDPDPVPINLEAGKRYYIELIQHEGGGGDPSGVTWTAFGAPSPADGTPTVLTGNLIGVYLLTGDDVVFTAQPANVTTDTATKATFTAAVSNQFPTYQWQRAPAGSSTFVNIPGATAATYTTDFLAAADNGAKYRVVVNIPGSTGTSAEATLTVNTAGLPTVLPTGAGALGNMEVSIEFDGLLDATTAANPANYSVSGSTIASVKVLNLSNGTKPFSVVKLTLATALAGATADVSIVAGGLKDINGNTVAAATKTAIVTKFTHKDIGNLPGDPVNPGDATAVGDGAFDVIAGGSDIHNAADGFHFVYAPVKGDFDISTRIDYILPVNNWSAGSINVRENLTPGSRNWLVKTTPNAVPTVDGATGANTFEFTQRLVQNGATTSVVPLTGATAPVYPNQYIRMTRVGQKITIFRKQAAADEWAEVGAVDLPLLSSGTDPDGNPIPYPALPEVMYLGLGTTSHNNGAGSQFVTTVLYRSTSLTGEIVPDPAVPTTINLTVVRNANGTLTISWTGGAGKLTQNSVIGTTTGWTDVPNGGTSPVTIDPDENGGNVFYRVERNP